MITRYVGGEYVKGGIYWNGHSAEFVSVPAEGGRLQGGSEERYVMVPLPLALTAGSLLGLAFILFLPLSGLVMLVPFLATKVRSALSAGKMEAARVAVPHPQPGISYLQPRPYAGTRRQLGDEDHQAGQVIDLAREIAEKRWMSR